jgi:hypothetical protein
VHDDCFFVESAMKCFKQVQRIYAAAGAADELELDLFDGGHRWGGRKSLAFFDKHSTCWASALPCRSNLRYA